MALMTTALTRTRFLGLASAGSIAVGGLALIGAAAGSTSAAALAPAGVHGAASPIALRVTPWLAGSAAGGARRLQVDYRARLTPVAIAAAQGLQGDALASVMAVVNGVQVDLN